MREIHVAKLPEFVEQDVRVSEWSTVRIKHCAYSVPSRLMGEWVKARIFEDKIEVWYRGVEQLSCERLRGERRHRIDYRHVIWSLVRKPGAFARYVYREELFPSVIFRRTYDAIQTPHRRDEGRPRVPPASASCSQHARSRRRDRSVVAVDGTSRDQRRRGQGAGDGEDERSRSPNSRRNLGRPEVLRRPDRGGRHMTAIATLETSPSESLAMLLRALKLPTVARLPRSRAESRARRLELRPVSPPPRRARSP